MNNENPLLRPALGASGDMITDCLLDLGADPDAVRAAVESVGCSLEIKRDEKHHIGASRARVQAKTIIDGFPMIAASRRGSVQSKS